MLDFIELGGNKNIEHKSEVIYPGTEFIDKAEIYEHKTKLRKSLGLDCDDLVIGTIGRVDFQKNPEKFVEIAKNFVSINKKSKFLWIGKGSLKDKIMNLIDEYNLKNHVIFTGFVDDVELYFSIFDIFILTSRYEGLPITIIKALSLGIPVVSFKINGVHDLTTKYNSVFGARPFETDSFIEKLKDCILYMENNSKNESLLIRKDFSNQKMLDNINKLYSKLYFKNNL
jgi:glycosyltransferase involved in cell wall biosynthesis